MSKGKVLIIEDQPGFRRVYHDILVSDGYEVLEAEDGEAGWAMVREKRPHLVLLDLGLPKMDGFEVLRRIKAETSTQAIPVIIFSVLGEQKDVKKGLELGASDYTVKGFYTPRQILSKIKNLMDRSDLPEGSPTYRIPLPEEGEDSGRLLEEIGVPGETCPDCRVGLVLELFPDQVKGGGHWFTARLICPNCSRSF